ncbi:hypothetical protein B9T24_15845 [Acinetobacter sp. ANC 4654]|uniref:hypothetical protein n=1 Tax=Acinetobacter sp. ANC 4654 TaxID=1977872 RepID=UPI000A3402EB|nr:hypothetical protein [Acinetobacter sp. ANC 4654]OTG91209.1 hypothetical protein B9T24_15845 [Acinetobacter sp. ANC 4654]
MLPKQLKILSTVLAILGIAAFFIFQYVMQPEKLAGFTEGTEQYNGYRYAKDNQLKSIDQCDDEKDDPTINFNQEFFEGCKQYFNHQ